MGIHYALSTHIHTLAFQQHHWSLTHNCRWYVLRAHVSAGNYEGDKKYKEDEQYDEYDENAENEEYEEPTNTSTTTWGEASPSKNEWGVSADDWGDDSVAEDTGDTSESIEQLLALRDKLVLTPSKQGTKKEKSTPKKAQAESVEKNQEIPYQEKQGMPSSLFVYFLTLP